MIDKELGEEVKEGQILELEGEKGAYFREEKHQEPCKNSNNGTEWKGSRFLQKQRHFCHQVFHEPVHFLATY